MTDLVTVRRDILRHLLFYEGRAQLLNWADAERYAEERLAAMIVSLWQPIEIAPRDRSAVLLYVQHQITEARFFPSEKSENNEGADTSIGAVWSCADDQWQIEVEEYQDAAGNHCYHDGNATHWMPLPEPPQ